MNPYDELFRSYILELRASRDKAMAWWESLLAREAEKATKRDVGELTVRRRWPCGPASHPCVLAVFRKYFLMCVQLNEGLDTDSEAEPIRNQDWNLGWGTEEEDSEDGIEMEPRFLLIERVEVEDEALGQFINHLVFVPIGVDPDGRVA